MRLSDVIVPEVQASGCPDAQLWAGHHLRMGLGEDPQPLLGSKGLQCE